MSDSWGACKVAKYVSLETLRKDGTGVRTPVWIAPDRDGPFDRAIVWTVTDSWKVKRIKRNPRVRLAPCNARGEVTGSWVDGYAEVMTHGQSALAMRALHRKYVVSRVVTLISRLRRGASGTVCIAITEGNQAPG